MYCEMKPFHKVGGHIFNSRIRLLVSGSEKNLIKRICKSKEMQLFI